MRDDAQHADDVRAVQVGWWREEDGKYLPNSYGAAAKGLGFEPCYVLRLALLIDGDIGAFPLAKSTDPC